MEATIITSFEKYSKSDKSYYALLSRMMFHGSRIDFWSLYNEAEDQSKKLYLIKDRWQEDFDKDPSIDWEQIILPQDIGMR